MKFHYICSECGQRFEINPHLTVCPHCSKHQVSDQPLASGRTTLISAWPPREQRRFTGIFQEALQARSAMKEAFGRLVVDRS